MPNPKSEIRSPKQIRSPKSEGRRTTATFRISDLGLLSDLGFRLSEFRLPHDPRRTPGDGPRVELRTNRLVNDMMVGAYLSRFKGRGMDFEELRDYIPATTSATSTGTSPTAWPPFVNASAKSASWACPRVDISGSAAFGHAPEQAPLRREVGATLAISARAAATRSACCSSPTRSSCFCRRAKAAAHSPDSARDAGL